eukprot:6130314-Pleurochrysis_carterae.AAC.1
MGDGRARRTQATGTAPAAAHVALTATNALKACMQRAQCARRRTRAPTGRWRAARARGSQSASAARAGAESGGCAKCAQMARPACAAARAGTGGDGRARCAHTA